MLNALLNNINAYIYVKDCSGHYVYVNQKVADLFGLAFQPINTQLNFWGVKAKDQ